MIEQYLTNAVAARNKKAIPSTDYNLTYVGLVYDGVTLQEDATTTLFAGIRNSVSDQVKSQFNDINKRITSVNTSISRTNTQIDRSQEHSFPGRPRVNINKIGSIAKLDSDDVSIKFPTDATSYSIPGLVYKKDRSSSSITGEYKSFDFTKDLPLSSSTILVKLSEIGVRDQVVTDLNSKGYNYTDYSKYKQYDTLEQYIYMILNIASGVFVVITGFFVLLNMAKFVSESRKEIGIFRAIGATKGTMIMLFVQQALLYITLSIMIGGTFGITAIFVLGNAMVTASQAFITSTLGSAIVLTGNISRINFIGIDYTMLGIYIVGMFGITLIASLIPALQASRVSPVDAIRNS